MRNDDGERKTPGGDAEHVCSRCAAWADALRCLEKASAALVDKDEVEAARWIGEVAWEVARHARQTAPRNEGLDGLHPGQAGQEKALACGAVAPEPGYDPCFLPVHHAGPHICLKELDRAGLSAAELDRVLGRPTRRRRALN